MNEWNPVELIASQQTMNRETWAALLERGTTEATEVSIDFFYAAENLRDAERLTEFLRSETDYEIEASDDAVTGSTRPTTISLAILNEWVEWMTLAGYENGRCRFDGWGTTVA